MEFTPGEDAVNIVTMTAKDIEYYINVVHKAMSVLERTDSSLKEVVLWVKCNQTEKSFMKGRVCQCSKPDCLPICLILRNCCNHPTFSNHHLDQSAAINIKARPSSSRKIATHWLLQWWLAFFKQLSVFPLRCIHCFLNIMLSYT